MIDLITMKAVYYEQEETGSSFWEEEIPESLAGNRPTLAS